MIERVRVALPENEYHALFRLSERELRSVPDQIRAIVRDRLRESGLLAEPDDGRCPCGAREVPDDAA